jgi:hypothetical protein
MHTEPTGLRLVRNTPRNDGTTQWRRQGSRLVPMNEAAETICELCGWSSLPEAKLEFVRKLGFAVEVAI